MIRINRWWLFVLIFGAWFLGTLTGAEATIIDARRNGYNVPHLWVGYK